MPVITREEFSKTLDGKFEYKFNAEKDGIYQINISARARSEKQIGHDATDDDDLRIEINGRKFPKLDNPTRYADSPAAFSGGKLHNAKKTIVFLLTLSAGEHAIIFIPDNSPVLETLDIYYRGREAAGFSLELDDRAEDGDRRPWVTIVLMDLPINSAEFTIKAERRFIDSDDVQISIDGEVVRNLKGGLRKLWYWLGRILKGDVEQVEFRPGLGIGLHYIALIADRMPWMKTAYIGFGEEIVRTPSVHDPVWTGSFEDDSDQILLARTIFGEARNTKLSDRVRVAIGWTIRSRVDNPSWWGNSYHSVITKPWQYSAFNAGDPNRKFVENPFQSGTKTDKNAWLSCYKIAGDVIRGISEDPTNGSNHYYDESISAPGWANSENFVLKIDTVFFHKL